MRLVGRGSVWEFYVVELYACLAHELESVFESVFFGVDDSSYAGLYYEFCALNARRCSDVECGSVAGVVGACQFGNGIGFSMEDVGVGGVVVVFAPVSNPEGVPL